MSAADLAFGRMVVWRGLSARIVDIQWRQHSARVRIQVAGGHTHWTSASELELP